MDSETEDPIDLVVPETPEHITKIPYFEFTTGSYSTRKRLLFNEVSNNREKAMYGSCSVKSEHCSLSPSHASQTPSELVVCGKSLIGGSTSSATAIPSPLRLVKSEHCSFSPTHISETPSELSDSGKFLIGETSSGAASPSPLRYVKSERCSLSPSHFSQTPRILAGGNNLVEATTSGVVIPSLLYEECQCNNDPTQIAHWEFVYHYFIPEYTKDRLSLSEWFSLRKCDYAV